MHPYDEYNSGSEMVVLESKRTIAFMFMVPTWTGKRESILQSVRSQEIFIRLEVREFYQKFWKNQEILMQQNILENLGKFVRQKK